MSKRTSMTALGLVLFIALVALSAAAWSPEKGSDKEQIQQVIESFFTLSEEGDWDAVGELLSDDFEIYTDQATAIAKPEYMQLLKADDMFLLEWKIADLEIQISADGSSAWSKYRGRFRSTIGGAPDLVETVETLIFTKVSGHWKISHGHASIKSLDPLSR
ncbi:MAG TPA: nuclear transport factor 2 family protein [Acidobacteriota bacterium]|nr:nuclear transport factor 2 family protein [Acidobacteriota bacterium]